MIFLTFFALPFLFSIILHFQSEHKFTMKEFLVQNLVVASLIGTGIATSICNRTADTEILNGYVTDKTRDRVSCSHSYKCMCYTTCSGSGNSRSCTEHCSTCYDHSYDIDWNVRSTIGKFKINRIDRQGLKKPSRWDIVKIGEPVSRQHSYTNYIKGSPESIFNNYKTLNDKEKKLLPKYPGAISDYYHHFKVLDWDIADVNYLRLNHLLNLSNSKLGNQYQVNMLVVFAGSHPEDDFFKLEKAWLGGKKNDAILVIGGESKPEWVRVMAWTLNNTFQVKLRDDILELPRFDEEAIDSIFASAIREYYVRKPMKDFEYLKDMVQPSLTAFIVIGILTLVSTIGLSVYFYKNDPFD